MSLASTAQRAHETVRGVKFAMLDGPTLVAVPVALQKHRVVAAGIGAHLARFERSRERLGNIASKKHGRKQMEKNGAILIQNCDLQVL